MSDLAVDRRTRRHHGHFIDPDIRQCAKHYLVADVVLPRVDRALKRGNDIGSRSQNRHRVNFRTGLLLPAARCPNSHGCERGEGKRALNSTS